MSEPVSLLPANATAWEMALSLTSAERRPLPAWLIKTVWSAEDCPERLLDILANTLSVDVWDRAWDEKRKRAWLKRAVPLHKAKGTLSALREYLSQLGGEIIRVTRPPEGFVLADSQTPAEYAAWVRSLPQLRIYQDRVRGLCGPFLALALDALDIAALGIAPDRTQTGRKAVLREAGVETPVGVDDSAGLGRLVVSLREAVGAFGALDAAIGCLAASDDLAPIYLIGVEDGAEASGQPARPGLRLQSLTPSYASDLVEADGVLGDRSPLDLDYFADDLVAHVHYRLPIVRPADAVRASVGDIFGVLDLTRFSIEARTAELATVIPGVFSDISLALDVSSFGAAVWDNDVSRLDAAFDALCAAKRGTDRIVANTNNYRPLVAGSPLYAGEDYRAGAWTRS